MEMQLNSLIMEILNRSMDGKYITLSLKSEVDPTTSPTLPLSNGGRIGSLEDEGKTDAMVGLSTDTMI